MRKLISLLFIFITIASFAQRIVNFYVFTAGTNVGLRFTIAKGVQCGGYKIYHSSDSISYSVVYDYPGICGGSGTDETISFTHNNPALNLVNYYKVELVPIETSRAEKIYVGEQIKSGLQVYPNPADALHNQLTLKLNNATSNLKLAGFIYDQTGKPIRQLDLNAFPNEALSLEIANLSNGLYVIWLANDNQAYTTKFLVLR
jgi:hypothetical protein